MTALLLFAAASIAALFAAMAAEQIKQRRALRRRRGPGRRSAPRKWIATRLRYLADRIDPKGAPRFVGYRFRIVQHVGIVFEDHGPGCPLWYLGEDDYALAFTTPGRPNR